MRYHPRMSATQKRWQAAAYIILGGGFLVSAYATLKDAAAEAGGGGQTRGLGKLGERATRSNQRALPPAKIGKANGQMHDVHNIDERVELIKKLIKKGSVNPTLHETTVKLLSQKCDRQGNVSDRGDRWCVPEKDCWAEVKWLFDAVRQPKSPMAVRYTRDMILADTFTAAERTLLQSHGGDCDDYVILLGSMLMSVGHPIKIRVIQTKDKASWSHVYLITPKFFPDDPRYDPRGAWEAVDCSVDKPCGWEAPGAKEVAKNNRPSGIVSRVKDYPMPVED